MPLEKTAVGGVSVHDVQVTKFGPPEAFERPRVMFDRPETPPKGTFVLDSRTSRRSAKACWTVVSVRVRGCNRELYGDVQDTESGWKGV